MVHNVNMIFKLFDEKEQEIISFNHIQTKNRTARSRRPID